MSEMDSVDEQYEADLAATAEAMILMKEKEMIDREVDAAFDGVVAAIIQRSKENGQCIVCGSSWEKEQDDNGK